MRSTPLNIFEGIDYHILNRDLTEAVEKNFENKPSYSSPKEVNEILLFCYDIYIKQILDLIHREKSFQFYSWVLDCYEHASESSKNKTATISEYNLAMFKRTLRILLEDACDLELISQREGYNEPRFYHVFKEIFSLVSKLSFLSGRLSEGKILGANIYLTKNPDGLYRISFDEIDELKLELVYQDIRIHSSRAIEDQNEYYLFSEYVEKALGVTFNSLISGISQICEHLNKNDLAPLDWDFFIETIGRSNAAERQRLDKFFRGLTLSGSNKSSLKHRIYKPNDLKRHLYRPLLEWTIDGKRKLLFRRNSFRDSLSMLVFATMPFDVSKTPNEWRSFIKSSADVTKSRKRIGDLLEDQIEELVKSSGLKYIRGFEYGEEKFEIDFLIHDPSSKMILVCECKNLMKKFDGNGWLNDASQFTNDFQPKMRQHLVWLNMNLDEVKRRFEVAHKGSPTDLSGNELKGVFILNAPTLYMYNSDFLTITWRQFDLMIVKRKYDFGFTMNNGQVAMSIEQPVFRNIPTHLTFFANEN